jgi:PTH2 family peptidyl-tRNA hydrolase
MLVSMGFRQELAEVALAQCDSAEDALEWLCLNAVAVLEQQQQPIQQQQQQSPFEEAMVGASTDASASAMDSEAASLLRLQSQLFEFQRRQAEIKVVVVVRTDLKMSAGKIAAQSIHAALGLLRNLGPNRDSVVAAWLANREKTVCLSCDGLDRMVNLQSQARALGLNTHIVCDAGRTEVAAGSCTVLAIGPDTAERIDAVTGSLKLFR